MSDPLRVSLVFSSQGMPYSMGRDALDAMETTYNLIFYTVLEKQTFVEEVRYLHCSVPRQCVLLSCHSLRSHLNLRKHIYVPLRLCSPRLLLSCVGRPLSILAPSTPADPRGEGCASWG